MDLRELRIGNLVQNKNGDVFEIDNVSESGVNGMSWTDSHYGNISGGFDYMYKSEEVFGVPITEEKLLDFGFMFLKNKSGTLGVYTNGKMNVTISNSGNVYRMSKLIPYVHRLQNLYFELRDEELTIKQK